MYFRRESNRLLAPRNIIVTGILIGLLIFTIDLMTNSLDIYKYDWDFKFYIAFAEDGFLMDKLSSPGAYRYMTPFLASILHHLFSLSIPDAFKVLAYVGLWLQLMGIYLFISTYFKSGIAGIIAMLSTAFSAVNVKFLLFDPFRPDVFAYFFVLLAIYLVFKKRVWWLMFISAIGVQFREFVVVPMISYVVALSWSKEWGKLQKYLVPIALTLFVAIAVPRILIPITSSYQSIQNIDDLLKVPLNGWRDFNWLYTFIIYFLPVWVLMTVERFRVILRKIPKWHLQILIIYTMFVALLSMYGGTDLARFSTYYFVPQIVMIGYLSLLAYKWEVLYMLITVFLFNKIYSDIPVWNSKLYVDWYGGYSDQVTQATFMHLGWMCVIILGAIVLRYLLKRI